jgi:hypothetical protein
MTTAREVQEALRSAGVVPTLDIVDRDPHPERAHGGPVQHGTCTWLVEFGPEWVEVEWVDENGEVQCDGDLVEGGVRECGAPATFDARGFRCENGHEHVTAEARSAEGWSYPEEW